MSMLPFFVYSNMLRPYVLSLLVLCSTLVTVSTQTSAQSVVVSEYFNNPGPSAAKEWTELLVVDDDVNLVGWTVFDHSNFNPTQGPVFQDIPLFRHLRAGTIIVIDHRTDTPPQQIDTVADDGFLLLRQLDNRFFSLGGNGLDVSQPGELIIIQDKNGKAVHALGHFNSQAIQPAAYTDLTCPKTAFNSKSDLSNNHSNRVTGRSLAAYGAGLGTDSTSYGPTVITAPPEDPGTGPSKGLPNLIDNPKRLAKRTNTNQLFWRERREPQWKSGPTLNVNSSDPTKNVLSWSALTDPYPSDGATGYMVLRDTTGFVPASFPGVHDGTTYKVGDKIGSATVLALQSTATGTSFEDKSAPCGSTFTYRVYGYRYSADDMMPASQTADTTARGRQYNEQFAQSATISKPKPPTPVITASRLVICPGDTTTLSTTATAGIEKYTWLRNGTPIAIGFTTRGVVSQPGKYRLVVTAPGGCTASSNEIEILPLPAPSVSVTPTGIHTMCKGDTLWFTVSTPAPQYELLRNNVVVTTQTSRRFALTEDGVYAVKLKTGTQCDGISETIAVTIQDIRYHLEPTVLDFGSLGECQTSRTMTAELVNDGNTGITISSVTLPPGYALTSPPPGFSVEPGKRQTLQLLFSPALSGTTAGTAQFNAEPCNVSSTLALTGVRTDAAATLDKVNVDFGEFSACPGASINKITTFEITNSGTAAIVVSPPAVAAPFFCSFAKDTLQPGEHVTITIRYIPFGPDLNRAVTQTIMFPFVGSDCTDTIRATLRAASYQPRVQLLADTIHLGSGQGCADTLLGSLSITNTGNVAVTIPNVTSSNVSYSGLPLDLPVGQTRSIPFAFVMGGGYGMHEETDTVLLMPCGTKVPVTITGLLQGTVLSADPPSLNLGDVLLCEGNPVRTMSTTIKSSIVLDGSSVRSVSLNAPFTSSLTVGTALNDTLPITITYSPVAPGISTDTMIVVLEPCGDSLLIPLTASAASVTRSTIISNPDFGTLSTGTSAAQTLVIENTGTYPISVDKLAGINPPWSVVSEVPTLPASIAPSDSVVVTLQYTYLGPDRADTTLCTSIVTAGPCRDSISLRLFGSTRPDTVVPIPDLRLVVPDNQVATIGKDVLIPLHLKIPGADSTQSSLTLKGKGVTDLAVQIQYNPTMLWIKSVDNTRGTGTSASVSEVTPGVAQLRIQSSTEIIESDSIVMVRASTYLGNAISTPLHLDSVKSSSTVQVTTDDGDLRFIGECAVSTQVVEFGIAPRIDVEGINEQQRTVVLGVTTLSDEPLVITITNIEGQAIDRVVANLRPGKHQVHVDVSRWPSGWYGATMQHGLYVGTTAFVVTH